MSVVPGRSVSDLVSPRRFANGWALFTAARVDVNAIDLSVQSNRSKATIGLAMPRDAAAAGERLPFAYQWIAGTDEQPIPKLIIIAAPTALIVDRDDLLHRTPSSSDPEVVVIRVQDPALVPPIGIDLRASNLLIRSDIYRPEGWTDDTARLLAARGIIMLNPPLKYFRVDRLADGVEISHPVDSQRVVIRVPLVATFRPAQFPFKPAEPVIDFNARFAYEVLPDGEEGGDGSPLVKIAKTRQVTVTARRGAVPPNWPQRPFWRIWNVPDPRDVPVQGQPVVAGQGWRLVRAEADETKEEMAGRAAVDVAVGMIPVAGDLIDVAEFVYAAVTGQDRWGRAVDELDLTLMAVAAALPFITSPLLRTPRRLRQAFGEHAQAATKLIDLMSAKGGLSTEEVKVIREMEALILASKAPPATMWEQWAEIVKRTTGAPPEIGSLLKGNEGFLHAELQEAYQAYKARRVKADATPLGPVEWSRAVTSGSPRELLERVLGAGYARAKRGGDVPMRLANIPVPLRFNTPGALTAELAKLDPHQVKLWERLDAFLDETDELLKAGGIPVVGRGRFRILKGNLAEVLSMEQQLAILRQIAAAEKRGTPVLVSGIRVRRTVDGKTVETLFSDNIIALVSPEKLDMKAVSEVKAGREGDSDVTLQIWEWIEGRLDEGAEIVIPRGATMTAADGTVTKVEKELVYKWHPTTVTEPTVVNLAAAPRHRFTARGTSTAGVDSEFRTTSRVIPHFLDQSSEELDYMVATLCIQKGVGSPP